MNDIQTQPALLIIDVQHGFFRTPERRAKLPALVTGINELAGFFRNRNLPVIHILTVQGPEVEELPGINHGNDDITISKPQASVFFQTELERTLWDLDVNTVVLAGYSCNASIERTALDAYERNFMPVLAGDAILGMDADMLRILENDYAIQPVGNERVRELVEGWISDSSS